MSFGGLMTIRYSYYGLSPLECSVLRGHGPSNTGHGFTVLRGFIRSLILIDAPPQPAFVYGSGLGVGIRHHIE